MKDLRKLAYLFLSLSLLLAAFFYLFRDLDRIFFWKIILVLSLGWFIYEVEINWKDKKKINRALMIGMILFIATFFFDYSGLSNRGYTINGKYSIFVVGADPVELLMVAFFGGSAWFLHVPKKFSMWYSVSDILLLAFFGAITEIMLNIYGIMTYLTVDSLNAFFTYALVWSVLHFLNYKVFK